MSTMYAGRACPLCGRADKQMRKEKKLYGEFVCKKCYYAFANRRQLAFVVDWVIQLVGGIVFAIGYATFLALVLGIDPGGDSPASWWAYEVVVRVLVAVPFLMKDGFSGYSPGKALCGVRVVHERTGQPIGFFRSLGRNLPLVIPIIPLVAAYQLQKGYRIGDKRVGTKVIWTKYASHPIFHVGPSVSAEEIEFRAPRPASLDDGNPYRTPMG